MRVEVAAGAQSAPVTVFVNGVRIAVLHREQADPPGQTRVVTAAEALGAVVVGVELIPEPEVAPVAVPARSLEHGSAEHLLCLYPGSGLLAA